jgi:ubiquinone/menaquinone biosynthesis C-methylase UbiE
MPTTEQHLRMRSPQEICDRYLAAAPISHALFRAAELAPLCEQVIERPVLDIGCGAGQFAALAVDGPLDAGIDSSPRQLRHARRLGCYQQLIYADARELPFAAGQFRSVLAISALEHMPAPDQVVAEAFRVLSPGGTFLATIGAERGRV